MKMLFPPLMQTRTYDIQMIKDAYIKSDKPNENHGSEIYAEVAKTTTYERWALIQAQHDENYKLYRKFYVSLWIYTLSYWGSIKPTSRTLKFYIIRQEWEENNVTWNNKPLTDTDPCTEWTLLTDEWEFKRYNIEISKEIAEELMNKGLLIKLEYNPPEAQGAGLEFYTKEHAQTTLHPFLRCSTRSIQ